MTVHFSTWQASFAVFKTLLEVCPQEGSFMRLKGLYFSLMLGFFGLLPNLGNLVAPSLGLAKPDTQAIGSVAGRVTIEGQLPQPSRISMSSDPSCAKAHPGPAVNEELVTGSGGTLGNVIVFVSDGLGNRTFEVPAHPGAVDQKGGRYLPHGRGIQPQQKLRMVNDDRTTDNLHPGATH